MGKLSRSKILIVDDTHLNIDSLVNTLGDEYDLHVANSGEADEKILELGKLAVFLNLAPSGRTFIPQHIPLFLGYN